ncbi:MAG TPA: MFS transporter [Mycobacterium sp.]|nr:MFS transporter [Mycobacterium sp.]
MTQPSPTQPLATDVPRARIAVASMVGTTIEFYDFYVYATAAVSVFPRLFFPPGNPTAALLASLATFGLAFAARPLGSVLFGHFGDRVGRKATLVSSLLVMGIATFAVGLLPTYTHVGVMAPALLAVMRFAQGLALGGEWSGAALLATESARPGRRGWMAMWPQLGAPLGFLLANALFLLLINVLDLDDIQSSADSAFYAWAWRIPFLLSAVMVAVGLYVRLKLTETPVFARSMQRGEPVKSPFSTLLRGSWDRVIIGAFVVLSAFTMFYIVTTWVLSYGTAPRAPHGSGLGFGYVEFLRLQLIAVLFFAGTIPVAGLLVDRFGRRRTLLAVSVGILGYGAAFTPLLAQGHASRGAVLAFLVIGMTLTGLAYGPMSAVLPELFPTNVRYSGSGVSFNIASIMGAAVAPFIATWLTVEYGVGYVGMYLIGMALLSLVAQLVMPETKSSSLDASDTTGIHEEPTVEPQSSVKPAV